MDLITCFGTIIRVECKRIKVCLGDSMTFRLIQLEDTMKHFAFFNTKTCQIFYNMFTIFEKRFDMTCYLVFCE